jgi:hypothetical protein
MLLGLPIGDTPVPTDSIDSTQQRRDLTALREEEVGALRAAPGVALTARIIELGIRVHRRPGPGLPESIYQECLCRELRHIVGATEKGRAKRHHYLAFSAISVISAPLC